MLTEKDLSLRERLAQTDIDIIVLAVPNFSAGVLNYRIAEKLDSAKTDRKGELV